VATVDDVFTATSTTLSTTIAVTVPRAVASGKKLILATVRTDSAGLTGGVSSITDSRGNSYTLHDAYSLNSATASVALHHCDVTTGLQVGDTITITFNASTNRKLAEVLVCSGLNTGAKDATTGTTITSNPTSTGPTGNSTGPSGTTGATTNAGGLTVAAVTSTNNATSIAAGSGYTGDTMLVTAAGSSDRRLGVEHKATSATGTQTAGFTLGSAAAWAVAIAHYPAPITVTASAGNDQEVEPWGETVTLTGTDTGTVTTRTWTQVSGTTVTLSGSGASRTFSTPNGTIAGEDLVFRYTVNGSVTDDVTISVLPSSLRAVISSAVVPVRIKSVP
jgi:hypothetical protein